MADNRKEPLTGKTFGKWKVKGPSEKKNKGTKFWDCICECGFEQAIPRWTLEKGLSKNCMQCKPKLERCIRGHEVSDWGRTPSPSCACRGCIKHKSLLREYGITLEEFISLWKFQEGKCALCKKPIALFSKGAPGWHFSECRPEVDHEHALGNKKEAVRGILCGGQWAGCNRKLGKIDNIEWLKAVVVYLQHPPAQILFKKEKS